MLEGTTGTTFNLPIKQVKDIIQKNKRGIHPVIDSFEEKGKEENQMQVHLDERIDRFDKKSRSHKNKRRRKHHLKKQV